MTDKIAKLTKILLWILFALTAFFSVMLFLYSDETDTKWIDISLIFAEVILYITIGAAVLSSLYLFISKLIAKPKKAAKSIMFLIAFCFILLFAYAASSDELLNMPSYEGQDNTEGVVKWTGTGIIMMYILLGLAVLSIIYYEISRLIKKSSK